MRFASIGVCLLVATLANGADLVGAARAGAEKNGKAVVAIRAVVQLKQSVGGQTQDQEIKAEITGVVIDASGLTVTSATALDPSAMVAQMLAAMGLPAEGIKVEAEIKDAMLVLSDGTEVPSDVVMKDTELDLAFLRPRDQSKKFDAVTLKARATPPQMLDDVFVVGRLGKLANRATSLTLGTVKAVVKGPRTFYVCDNEVSANAGCLVYGADSEPLGLLVTRVSKEAGGGGMGMLGMLTGGGPRDMMMPIVRAIEDVIEIAAQAKNAKAPAKAEAAAKPEEKKEEKKEAKK